ncbi:MAG: RluA family pseudouridine synthase [Firmicutes bacterium]|nr:RluA family pseudouridine synthase [Bacillota bacterium]
MIHIKIIVENENIRIDKYLSEEINYSRELITKMILNNYILVNNKSIKPSYKIKLNDEILIDESFVVKSEIVPENIPLDIVFEDEYLIVLNKPSGLVVHPGSGNYNHTLVNALMFHKKNLSNINSEERPGIVHRLDKDTSGLMIVAKTNEAHQILADCFKNKEIHREYIALLNGKFPSTSALIDAPIGRDKDNHLKYKVTGNGKKAKTNLKVLKKYENHTLVKLVLETGRTHQIRVHMEYIGYPVFNDPVYGKQKSNEFGQYLHSHYLKFKHPITNKILEFRCDLPKEFQNKIAELDNSIEKN